MSKTAVKDALRALAEKFLIEVQARIQDGVCLPNQYLLKIPGVGRQTTGGESPADRGWVAERPGVGRQTTTKQEVETGIEPIHTPGTAAQISIAMRKYSIAANPAHPTVIAIAEQGVSVETVEACCKETREAKPNESISVGYIAKKLAGWAKEAATLNVRGSARRSDPRGKSFQEINAETIAALTGRDRDHEFDDRTIDV